MTRARKTTSPSAKERDDTASLASQVDQLFLREIRRYNHSDDPEDIDTRVLRLMVDRIRQLGAVPNPEVETPGGKLLAAAGLRFKGKTLDKEESATG